MPGSKAICVLCKARLEGIALSLILLGALGVLAVNFIRNEEDD